MRRVRPPVCSAADSALQWCFEVPAPSPLSVGAGSAVALAGWCFHRDSPICELSFLTAGRKTPALAHSLPRPDVRAALYPERDPHDNAYASGFYAVIPLVGLTSPEETEVVVQVTLPGERSEQYTADVIKITPGNDRAPLPARSGCPVTVAMATYNPPYELFARQIDSIAQQSFEGWRCVISDDRSHPQIFDRMCDLLDGDDRFVIDRSRLRMGAYYNFERALSLVDTDTHYVALADQDDLWYPHKLERLATALESGAVLAYSDSRVVGPDGDVIAQTFFARRRNNSSDLRKMLLANSVTGASSMFRRDLLDHALPFPPLLDPRTIFHDHWLAVVALALGRLHYVEMPLYDYVQHGENTLGHGLHEAAERGYRGPWTLRSRATYESKLLRTVFMATALDERLRNVPAARLHDLRSLTEIERSPRAIAALASDAVRPVSSTPTEGVERELLGALAWRRRMTRSARRRDRIAHPWYSAAPDVADAIVLPADVPRVQALSDATTPLHLEVRDDEPARVNLLIRQIEIQGMFDNSVGRLSLAASLANAGLKTRVVVCGSSPPGPELWQQMQDVAGTPDATSAPEIVSAQSAVPVSDADVFIATDWSTAHMAHAATTRLQGPGFLYLIDDYAGTQAVEGVRGEITRSYTFPHCAVFWGPRLQVAFQGRQLGVFSNGESQKAAWTTILPALTPVGAPTADELAGRSPSRLLFHAPEHPDTSDALTAAGVLAIDRVADALSGWEVNAIGSPLPREIRLAGRLDLVMLDPRSPRDYADLLRRHDVGVSLVSTARLTSVALEMAAAALPTVVVALSTEDERWLEATSVNLIPVQPAAADVARGLTRALEMVNDFGRRVGGSALNQPTSWQETYNPDALEQIISLIEMLRKRPSRPNGAARAVLRRVKHGLVERGADSGA